MAKPEAIVGKGQVIEGITVISLFFSDGVKLNCDSCPAHLVANLRSLPFCIGLLKGDDMATKMLTPPIEIIEALRLSATYLCNINSNTLARESHRTE